MSPVDSAHVAPTPPSANPPREAISTLSNDGTYNVAYVADPSPIPQNDAFGLRVWVRDARDPSADLTAATLAADAAMPAHQHGMNTQPAVKPLGPGSFRVDGMLFHMSGHWELYLDITRDGITERAQFDVELE